MDVDLHHDPVGRKGLRSNYRGQTKRIMGQALRFPHELCPLHRLIDRGGSLASQGLQVCPTIRDIAEQI